MNRNHVLRVLRQSGPMSRPEVARLTGLSKPTVNEVVAELVAAGMLTDALADPAGAPRRPGPKPKLVAFRHDQGYVLGIDVGAAKSLVFLADLAGTVHARERLRTSDIHTRDRLLGTLRDGIDRALDAAGLTHDDVRATVVGTPGVVDPGTGEISLAPQLPGWEGIHLSQVLDPRLTCTVRSVNEVDLAILGERWKGAAHDTDAAVYLAVGVGVGLGSLVDGRLHRGAHGAAGEIGYLPIGDGNGVPPGVGRFEYAVGGRAYARLGREAARKRGGRLLLELAGGSPDAVDAAVVFEAARRGSSAARRIVDQLVRRLAEGLASVCLTVDPATVIVGGGVSRAGDALLEPLARHVRDLVPFPPRLALSELGEEAVALGAIRLGLDLVDEQLYAIPAHG